MNLTVGIVGAGIIAKEHMQAIDAINELQAVAIADIDERKAKKMAEEFKVTDFTNYRHMIQEETPDIVVITLPHYLHREAAVFSANQGCHILLEKPMALNTLECEEIMEAAKGNNVQLMVGHIQRYFQENIITKKIIEEERLGDLVMVNENRYMNYFTEDRPSWFYKSANAGGGIVMNLGAHCIDKVQWMLGTRFSKVLSKMSYVSKNLKVTTDIEGSGLLFLETTEGIPATISLCGYEVVPRHATELFFTRGMVRVEAGKGVWVSKEGVYERIDTLQVSSPFEKQLIELVSAINGDGTIDNSGDYAKSIIQVIEGCYQSHVHGNAIEL
ncbi:Gfo/Idh/MocA family protein [Virgibacillus sp. L01]|uniref:Gfo/Idh/MocA family protein n=1 Tax=Virgibacillus sp. L01 TaxID=3457429 RepID=UPI003FD36A8E